MPPLAEALYNQCQFEHALVLFHRGKRLAPDMEEFRLGVQKCRKTIQNAISSQNVFKVRGARILFRIFRRLNDMRTARFLVAIQVQESPLEMNQAISQLARGPGALSINLSGLTGIVDRKKRDQQAAKQNIFKRWGKPIDIM